MSPKTAQATCLRSKLTPRVWGVVTPVHGSNIVGNLTSRPSPSWKTNLLAPIEPLVKEVALAPTQVVLNYRQRKHACRLAGLPEGHPAEEILPLSMRHGDTAHQPGKQSTNDTAWAETSRTVNLGQRLAKQVLGSGAIDLAYGTEPVIKVGEVPFQGQMVIQTTEQAIRKAQNMTQAHEFLSGQTGPSYYRRELGLGERIKPTQMKLNGKPNVLP